MKNIGFLVTALALLMTMFGSGYAHGQDYKTVVVTGKANCPLVPLGGGTVFLHLTVQTPSIERPARRPLNLAVVLDRSGSMGDERKIQYAKSALNSLIDQLSPDDLLSVVIYDDIVEVLRPASKVGNRHGIRKLLERIEPRGSTNLGGGMIKGLEQASKYASRRYVNRVILLSDGLANEGITDPHELGGIARRYRERSISVTTMGVGLDYNENLMVSLAEYSGGNYYFIESPHSIAHILRREFKDLSMILAQNAILELRSGHGVEIVDVIGYSWNIVGDRCEISLGDLMAGRSQDIIVELRLPEGSGLVTVARGSMSYEVQESSLRTPAEFSVAVTYTGDQNAVERHRDLETQAKADVAVSTRKVEQALEALDKGDREEAEKAIEDARMYLGASPAAEAPAIQEQAKRLGDFRTKLEDKDQRRAKKSIQYDNRNVQKNNE